MTVTPLGRDQDCSLKNQEPDGPAPWFQDPGGWSKTTAVRLFFIFPGICTLSLGMDIVTDPNCSRTTDPDTALGSSSTQIVTMALVVTQATQISPEGSVAFRH
ncbi:hypothetical protein STEG23_019597 [Scotinomys teguina]